MKFVGAKYGNKNVKIILVEKMMLCNDEIFGGKSWQATYPQSPSLLQHIHIIYIYIFIGTWHLQYLLSTFIGLPRYFYIFLSQLRQQAQRIHGFQEFHHWRIRKLPVLPGSLRELFQGWWPVWIYAGACLEQWKKRAPGCLGNIVGDEILPSYPTQFL